MKEHDIVLLKDYFNETDEIIEGVIVRMFEKIAWAEVEIKAGTTLSLPLSKLTLKPKE